ncbi:MAG: two-component regulator propeller domain-containing protein [Candidatus Pseudobacter hemicellulosilyticus]|uniref:histidine kinase n=1 Tax=Candidatus Pseudobacter hemicellulosilyticus TaxID=3121375 RepID=A0AAJ5WVQ4_9BACT|nr:MAG: two-component regulator propeller domain-containing protein [Pseudobacter sp.]
MKTVRGKFYLFMLISLLSVPLYGQQVLFRNYTVAEGLSANTVRAIVQDNQGFLWFGTKNGISRFDGYQFKRYQFNKNKPGSLGNNFIHALCRADSTHIWIGTENGVYILDLSTELFDPLPGLEGNAVFDILRDSKGNTWITTRLNGLYKIAPGSRQLQLVGNREKGNGPLTSRHLTQLAEDNNGHIWIGTYGYGLDVLDPASMRVTNYNTGNGLTSNYVIAVYKDGNGRIWSGTFTRGVSMYDPQTRSFTSYHKNSSPAINDDIVRGISQPEPGKIFIGTEKGLNILDEATGAISSYQNHPADPFSISDNSVYRIYPDRNGTTWIGTYFGGVSYFRPGGSAFELYYPTGNTGTLTGRAVSCFLEDEPGKFWIGTEDGGLQYFDSRTKVFRQYPFLPRQPKLAYHNVHALLKDGQGRLWIGLFAGGINRYDPATGAMRQYLQQSSDPHSLLGNHIFSLYQDKEGIIWVGTDQGLNKYDSATDGFIRFKEPGLYNTIVYDMLEDASRNLYVATYNNGLYILNKRTDQWHNISNQTKGGALATNKLICLHDDNNGHLWIGTDGGGLHKLNKRSGKMTVYDQTNGIDANVIYSLQEDDEARLWMGTNNGIYSLAMGTGQFHHFSQKDNLQSAQFNYKSALKAADGSILMGGVKGFNLFRPEKVADVRHDYTVIITGFQLFNKEVAPGPESVLSQSINYTNRIRLAHDQSVFSFEFTGIGFTTPEKVRYAYRMKGFDEDWNFVGNERKATYTNLSPGSYTFMVKAGLDDNSLSSQSIDITIIISPPFYKTTLAYILYCLLAILAGWLGYRYFVAYHRRRNAAKLERMKIREEQDFYARKIEFFTMMAHEIRTPLSLIIAPLEKLLTVNRWQGEEQEQLKIMDDNASRLMSLVNQLLDFRRIESDAYEIHPEEIELVSLVQAVYSRFSSLPYQQGIEFSMSTRINRLPMVADPEVLNKILSNLLINAFKFTRSRVNIRINELNQDNDQAYCSVSVEDDGIGISSADIQHIFKKFFTTTSGNYAYHNLGGSGIGLALASSLAEKHGGRLLVESRQEVKTIFTLELPYFLPASGEPVLPEPEDTGAEADTSSTILVVEDDTTLLDFISKTLRGEGFRVEKAHNGKEALEKIDQQSIDLVLSDVMMPGMDGFELCRKVRNDVAISHLPFVLLTARSNQEAEIEGVESGADAFISKPFKWKHVMAVVKNLLETREKLRLKFSEQPGINAEQLTSNPRDKEFIERILAIIGQRITDPQLSVEELGKELSMSRSNLHKKLKALSGMGPNELIRLIRLKHAAKLLAARQHTVAEVAYLSGFSSPSYFTKCFQQQFKVTPKEFAERQPGQARPDFDQDINLEQP